MPEDEVFRRFLRLSAVGYGLGALSLAFTRRRSDKTLAFLDRSKNVPAHFYGDLATAYMATIATAAFVAGRDRRVAAEMAVPLFAAKGATTGLFLWRFIRTKRPLYLVSAAVDGSLLTATALLRRYSRRPQRTGDNVTQLRAG